MIMKTVSELHLHLFI